MVGTNRRRSPKKKGKSKKGAEAVDDGYISAQRLVKLESDFVSKNTASPYERLLSVLNLAKFTELKRKPTLIERFGGLESIAAVMRSRHPCVTYAKYLTKGTLAKVLLSKFEDAADDIVRQIESMANEANDETVALEANALVKDKAHMDLLCVQHVTQAILYLINDFTKELKDLADSGWGGPSDGGDGGGSAVATTSHPLVDPILEKRTFVLQLVHGIHMDIFYNKDAFGSTQSPGETSDEKASFLLEILESPKATTLSVCSSIVSALVEGRPDLEQYMETCKSMELHADQLDQIVAIRSDIDSLITEYTETSELKEGEYNVVLDQFLEKETVFNEAAEAARRGLKTLKEAAAIAKREMDAAQDVVDENDIIRREARNSLQRGLAVKTTFMTLVSNTVEAVGILANTLEGPKQVAISRFVVDELLVFAKSLVAHDGATVTVCNSLERLAFGSKVVQDVINVTGGIEISLELFRKRKPCVKEAVGMLCAAAFQSNVENADYFRSIGGMEDILSWIEQAVAGARTGDPDCCATTKLLAVLCHDSKDSASRGLQGIKGDRGLTALLSIICTGNACAHVAALALSNSLAASLGSESAARVMETGGLENVCVYLKSCDSTVSNSTIKESLKVVRLCCEKYRPEAQDLAANCGIFPYVVEWACEFRTPSKSDKGLPTDALQVEACETLRWMTLNNFDIQLFHTEGTVQRCLAILKDARVSTPMLRLSACRWISSVVEDHYEMQSMINSLGGYSVLVNAAIDGTRMVRAHALLALATLATENNTIKDLVASANNILNVVDELARRSFSDAPPELADGDEIIWERCGIARFIWKAAEKHKQNREALCARNGIANLCKWCHDVSAFKSPQFAHHVKTDEKIDSQDDGQVIGTLKQLGQFCVHGLMTLLYNNQNSQPIFRRHATIANISTFLTHCRGITMQGIAMLTLSNLVRAGKDPVRDMAVEQGCIPVLASELFNLVFTAKDPSEPNAHDAWLSVNCACEALEVLCNRHTGAQEACLSENVLQTLASILIDIDKETLISTVPDESVVHALDLIGAICQGNPNAKALWRTTREGTEGVRRWSVQCERNPALRISIGNILNKVATGYGKDEAQHAMNITRL
jgi:hypothetical protein